MVVEEERKEGLRSKAQCATEPWWWSRSVVGESGVRWEGVQKGMGERLCSCRSGRGSGRDYTPSGEVGTGKWGGMGEQTDGLIP